MLKSFRLRVLKPAAAQTFLCVPQMYIRFPLLLSQIGIRCITTLPDVYAPSRLVRIRIRICTLFTPLCARNAPLEIASNPQDPSRDQAAVLGAFT